MASLVVLLIALMPLRTAAQTASSVGVAPATEWAEVVGNHYLIYPDVQYGFQNNYSLRLDVWQRKDAAGPVPTLIYYHGGGWVFGDRTGATLFFLPYLQMGWNVVNVEYRMASVSLAPAAVEDSRCALRWAIRNAKQYNIDVNKIVLTGHSAGGHLSLIAGMLPSGTPLDNECTGEEQLKVAAIVNWFGISDVNDILQGPNQKNYALMWLGSQGDAKAIAKSVSPITYVRSGLPPTFSVHGDADDVVPYSHSVRLHKALTAAGVPNELVTIKGGGHGQFTDEQTQFAYEKLHAFLRAHGLEK